MKIVELLRRVKGEIFRALDEVTPQRLVSNLNHYHQKIRHSNHLPPLSEQGAAIVAACRREGVAVTSLEALGLPSTDTLLSAAAKLLPEMEVARAAEQKEGWQLGTADRPAYPQIFTVTDLPEFTQWATEPQLLNIIENYIGVPIAFQGIHLRRDFANETPVTTELWHRDKEDRRLIKIFLYLTDVKEENGPFEYVPANKMSSLKGWLAQLGVSLRRIKNPVEFGIKDSEMALVVPRSQWKNCAGPAGTVIFADAAKIFHHGKTRKEGRFALFFVYTAKEPLRPQDCSQYHDLTFARPELKLAEAKAI